MFEKEQSPIHSAFLPAVVTPMPSQKQIIDSSSSVLDVTTLEGANGVIKINKSKAVKRRAKWKKPKDKPKRPLSAYNIFFKEQREILMQDKKLSSSKAVRGFSGLAKFVGAKWTALDAASRSVYEAHAREEKKRYYVALAAWKHGKEQKGWNRLIAPLPSLGNTNKSPPYSLPILPMIGPLGIPFSPFQNNLCCPNLWMNGSLPSQLCQNVPSESPLEKELREFENSLQPSDARVVEDDSHESFSSWLEDAFDSEEDVLHMSIDDSSNVNLEQRDSIKGVLCKNIDDCTNVDLEQRNSESTAMTRVLQTFDHLGVDEEFEEFLSSM